MHQFFMQLDYIVNQQLSKNKGFTTLYKNSTWLHVLQLLQKDADV